MKDAMFATKGQARDACLAVIQGLLPHERPEAEIWEDVIPHLGETYHRLGPEELAQFAEVIGRPVDGFTRFRVKVRTPSSFAGYRDNGWIYPEVFEARVLLEGRQQVVYCEKCGKAMQYVRHDWSMCRDCFEEGLS